MHLGVGALRPYRCKAVTNDMWLYSAATTAPALRDVELNYDFELQAYIDEGEPPLVNGGWAGDEPAAGATAQVVPSVRQGEPIAFWVTARDQDELGNREDPDYAEHQGITNLGIRFHRYDEVEDEWVEVASDESLAPGSYRATIWAVDDEHAEGSTEVLFDVVE